MLGTASEVKFKKVLQYLHTNDTVRGASQVNGAGGKC